MGILSLDQPAVRSWLLSLFPPGFDNWMDVETSSSNVSRYLDALADALKKYGTDLADTLRAEINPSTAIQKLPDWEAALGITQQQAAAGNLTTAARQTAVVAALRRSGTFTVHAVRAIIGRLLGYENPNLLTIIEPDRISLASANTYVNNTGGFLPGGGALVQKIVVADNNAPIGPAGVQLTVSLTTDVPTDITVTLTPPVGYWGAGPSVSWVLPLHGKLTLYAPQLAGFTCAGTWGISFVSASAAANLSSWQLFAEAVGFDTLNIIQGHGAGMYEWAVQIDPTLEGVAHGSDEGAARFTLGLIKPAHTSVYIIKRMVTASGLDLGGVAIADNANAIADGCTCG